MDKPRIKEAIVVEGRYDKNTLSQVVDALILETKGFGVFNDKEKLALLRRIAEKDGLIVLTDSDGAGFVIRNYLKGSIDPALVKHAYIPDREGKERRKRTPGKEGKLGVEGMRPQVLLDALRTAGATFLDQAVCTDTPSPMTKADLFEEPCVEGGYLLLCTDGLSNLVTDQEILYEVIHGGAQEDCCKRLLDTALQRGAPDNVTVILLRM